MNKIIMDYNALLVQVLAAFDVFMESNLQASKENPAWISLLGSILEIRRTLTDAELKGWYESFLILRRISYATKEGNGQDTKVPPNSSQ